MKIEKNEKRFIPTFLLTELQKSDYPKKDDLYCIIDLINRKFIAKNRLRPFNNYVELSRTMFAIMIPTAQRLSNALDWLENKNIIEIKHNYSTGHNGFKAFAKGYKLTEEWLGDTIGVEITDKFINKRLKAEKQKYRKIKVRNMEDAKKKYYKNFKIDLNNALTAIKDLAVNDILGLAKYLKINVTIDEVLNLIDNGENCGLTKLKFTKSDTSYNNQIYSILDRMIKHQSFVYAISEGYLYFKRNKTNNRLDSNLTNLPSYLRKFIISDSKLFNIDIKNSQPYFLYTLLKEDFSIDTKEVEKYGKLAVNGTLYEHFIPLYEIARLFPRNADTFEKKRNYVKNSFFKIFYSKLKSFLKFKAVFGNEFPQIMEYINQKNKVDNSELAVALQKRESETVLDLVAVEVQSRGLELMTIHDSIVCSENDMPLIFEILRTKCVDLFGAAPNLSIDLLFDNRQDEEQIEYYLEEELEMMAQCDAEDNDYDFGDLDLLFTA